MNTKHVYSDQNLQTILNSAMAGDRIVVHGEQVGQITIPVTAKGIEFAMDNFYLDGRDAYPFGPLDHHNGGIGYAEKYLFTCLADNVKIFGKGDVVNSRGSGVRINAQNNQVDGLTINNCRAQLMRIDGKNHVVENIIAQFGCQFNTSDRSGSEDNWFGAVALKDGENCFLRNFRISNNHGEGLNITGFNNEIENFEIFDCYSSALYFNRCGQTKAKNILLYYTGDPRYLRGGSNPGLLTFGLEAAPKQQNRPATKGIEIDTIVCVNGGPNVSFRAQKENEGYENITIKNGTFYESRETGKSSHAVWLNPKVYYKGVSFIDCEFVQTEGAKTNSPKTLDLEKDNFWITTKKESQMAYPFAKQIFTGNLENYTSNDAMGASWWDKTITQTPYADTPPEENPIIKTLESLSVYLEETSKNMAEVNVLLKQLIEGLKGGQE